jgi:hypothetical protein
LERLKDYDLIINYHPGKANVVADTLRHRSYVSQLVVDRMPFELSAEFDKLNLRIVANTEATEMNVGSNLFQEIQKGQMEDEIKRNIKEEKSPGFRKMRNESCVTREGFVCLASRNWRIRYFMKHMSLLILFIQEGIRCIMISRPVIGGMEWRETLPSMLLFVKFVSESRLNINDLLDCCSRCKCLSESGKKLP